VPCADRSSATQAPWCSARTGDRLSLVGGDQLARAGLRRGPEEADRLVTPCSPAPQEQPGALSATDRGRPPARQGVGIELVRSDHVGNTGKRHRSAAASGRTRRLCRLRPGRTVPDAVDSTSNVVLMTDEIAKANRSVPNPVAGDGHGTRDRPPTARRSTSQRILILTDQRGRRDSRSRDGLRARATHTARRGQTSAIEKMFTPEFRNRLDATSDSRPDARGLDRVSPSSSSSRGAARRAARHDRARRWRATRGCRRRASTRCRRSALSRVIQEYVQEDVATSAECCSASGARRHAGPSPIKGQRAGVLDPEDRRPTRSGQGAAAE